jgi:hypothetical protein
MTPTYTHTDCLQNSYKINWRISDVLGDDNFDKSRRWLPRRLSGAGSVPFLTEHEKTCLTHVEMGAYVHLFGYVEEFIAPEILNLAGNYEIDEREAFDALANFAAEEVKHMTLFRNIRARVDETLGFRLRLLEGEKEVARAVLSKNRGAVLLLTAAIEWFTQLHYLEAFKDDEGLDPLTKKIFRAHWQEESQHARMDHLETLRAFADMSEPDKEQAITDLIVLVGEVDGLLRKQTQYDLGNLEEYLNRLFTTAERDTILRSVLRAKRYAFIESGVTHPNFKATFVEVTTPTQQDKVAKALGTLLQEPAAA